MPKGKLSSEGEVMAAYGAAMVASFQILINCLEESDALFPGQFPDALRVYVEMVKSRKGDVSDMTLAVLHDIRMATLDSSFAREHEGALGFTWGHKDKNRPHR